MKDYLAQFQGQKFPGDTSSGQLTELPKPPSRTRQASRWASRATFTGKT